MTELRQELMALEAFTFQMEAATDPVELIRTAERTFQCIERIRDAVWNSVAPIPAPAEPSGNTGELPVCATCGGTGVICDIHGRDDIYQEDDSYEQRCMICVGDERSGELVACPDCSASGSLPDQEGKKREK